MAMLDIPAQIAYWRSGAEEDWAVAQELLASGRVRHSLFLAHLELEKALKAHVCRETQDLPPRTHNLVRLAELADLKPSQEQADVLAEMNAFHVEGRYPYQPAPPGLTEARRYVTKAEGVIQWLISLL
jgi:HEPN domain-containing protein